MRMEPANRVGAIALALLLTAAGATASQAQDADAQTLQRGKDIFLETAAPQCALCHALADAGSTAEIGPILDQLKPDEARIRNAVRNGVGIMPAYADTLDDADIDAVATYVAAASAGKL